MSYFGSRDALTFVNSLDFNEMLHSTSFHQIITICSMYPFNRVPV